MIPEIKEIMVRKELVFALALFFSLMSIPMPRNSDVFDLAMKWFLAVMAAAMLYLGLKG